MFELFVAVVICALAVLFFNSRQFDSFVGGFFDRVIYDIKHSRWYNNKED